MKILILGSADSIWVKEYIEFVLLKEFKKNIQIYVTGKRTENDFLDFYKKNGVSVIELDRPVPMCKNGKIRTAYNLYTQVRSIAQAEKFDIIHIHYIPANLMSLVYRYGILKYGKRTIVSFWGSDLLAASNAAGKIQQLCLNKSDAITVSGIILKRAMEKRYGCQYDNKLHTVRFGITALSYIDEIQKDHLHEDIKKMLGIGSDKILIAIGYNARESQHHLDVLKQFKNLDEGIKSKYAFVLQFGTGDPSEEYKELVYDCIEQTGIEYLITTEFLDKVKTAVLRSAVDIFIHAQDTDALSASVQEYLYAGAHVLNPKWIDYKELKDAGAQYLEYSKFEEIVPLIMNNCDFNQSEYRMVNKKAVKSVSSWDMQRPKWIELYKSSEE